MRESAPALRRAVLHVVFHSGLAILEQRIREGLAAVGSISRFHALGRVRADSIAWDDVLMDATLHVVGPDLVFEEALASSRACAAAAPGIPILWIRGEGDLVHVRAAAEAGARAYLPFPFEPEPFRRHAEDLLTRNRLAAVTARDLMRPVALEDLPREDEPLARSAARLLALEAPGLPVLDPEGRAVGFLSTRDLLLAYRLRGPHAGAAPTVRCMTHRVVWIEPDATADAAIALATRHGLRSLPVLVDGRPTGMVDRLDLVRALL